MSLVLQSSGGGQITIQEPATASNFTQTLPAVSGTVITTGNIPTGSVLQVVTGATTVDINTTGVTILTVNITPSSASNKILALFAVTINMNPTSNAYGFATLNRNGTGIKTGQAGIQLNQNLVGNAVGSVLDSPATTSSVSYTLYAGRGSGGTSSVDIPAGANIILMEIAA
jgi:hypothetical protein